MINNFVITWNADMLIRRDYEWLRHLVRCSVQYIPIRLIVGQCRKKILTCARLLERIKIIEVHATIFCSCVRIQLHTLSYQSSTRDFHAFAALSSRSFRTFLYIFLKFSATCSFFTGLKECRKFLLDNAYHNSRLDTQRRNVVKHVGVKQI